MLPELFLKRMQEMLGDEYEAFLQSYEQEKYQALRLNSLKKTKGGESAATVLAPRKEACREPLFWLGEKTGFHLREVPWAKDGYYYEKEDQPGKHPYHEAGLYYIQEPSAMAPVTLLEVQPGERVLDLCAAPGGKSTQIAAALQGKGLLISNEIHPARAKILSENIERMGIRNACVTNETPQHLSQLFPEYFDRILVDAPCSGEGMFRKNEEACGEWSRENVELCAERQDEVLDCAAQMLLPGGRLVYSTCTFAPQENEGSINRFMERHPEFSLVKTLRLWPHHIQGEGHFAAVLEKAGSMPVGYQAISAGGFVREAGKKDLEECIAFYKEFLQVQLPGKYIKFGEHIYLVPEDMPNLQGLKVLRPGLHMGTLKKNRFEPSHALALALAPDEAVNVWNLSLEDDTVRAYLNGQTFSASGEKGWYLICVDGFSLGWGKLAGGIMKNHY
ncbi:MAG: RsmB/NOP family class I SAM-dependent RNA methyltransferase, partial [Acetatifactor sp.]